MLGYNKGPEFGDLRTKACLCFSTLAPADKTFFGITEEKYRNGFCHCCLSTTYPIRFAIEDKPVCLCGGVALDKQ